ncbi:MAG: hypothetical protein ACXWJM_07800 [Ramlibacter sp.]
MRWLVQSAIIFFGTLMAAGLVALGAPAALDVVASTSSNRQVAHAAAPATSLQHRADIRWAVHTAAIQTQR